MNLEWVRIRFRIVFNFFAAANLEVLNSIGFITKHRIVFNLFAAANLEVLNSIDFIAKQQVYTPAKYRLSPLAQYLQQPALPAQRF